MFNETEKIPRYHSYSEIALRTLFRIMHVRHVLLDLLLSQAAPNAEIQSFPSVSDTFSRWYPLSLHLSEAYLHIHHSIHLYHKPSWPIYQRLFNDLAVNVSWIRNLFPIQPMRPFLPYPQISVRTGTRTRAAWRVQMPFYPSVLYFPCYNKNH